MRVYPTARSTPTATGAIPSSSEGSGVRLAEPLRGQLVHRGAVAEIDAGRLLDGGAGEDGRLFAVVAVAALGARVPEIAQHQDLVLQAGQRLERRREFEVAARRPSDTSARRIDAVRHVQHRHAHGILRRLRLRRARTGIIASSQGRPRVTPAPRKQRSARNRLRVLTV